MIKLVASDCDGTLLNNDTELDEETAKAIRRFQETGGIFMLATGRNRWDTSIVTDKVSDLALNCDNGCALYDTDGTRLLIHRIDNSDVRSIYDLSLHYDFPVMYHGLGGTYFTYDYETVKERAIHHIASRYTPMMAEDIFDWVFNNRYYRYGSDIEDILNDDIIKLEPICIVEEEYDLVLDECCRIFSDMNVMAGNFISNIEINSIESDKGAAIKEYCRLKGIKDEEVIVIGDSENDISMFQLFDNSYCVNNGQMSAKRAASHIIDSNDELGVAKLLNRICDDKNV